MEYDIVVVGGGINGAGIARDAAGRGYSVCLVEKDDLAQATSSASTKLIHGGLRYLEHYAFRLVREALQERTILQKMAPHIIWPMRFVLPHHKGLRPAWLIRLGLFIYDHLDWAQMVPKSVKTPLRAHPAGAVLSDEFATAFIYSDCWVEDSRLVVLNALDAEKHGASIRTRTKLTSARPLKSGWQLTLTAADGTSEEVSCKMLVNAAGPWAMDILQRAGARENKAKLRLIKGSHLIFDRKLPCDEAFLLQNTDGRITFIVPYEGRFTLVGTTDVDINSADGPLDISEPETNYLLEMVNPYLKQPLTKEEICGSYAGVRPLYDDGSGQAAKANRDYQLAVSHHEGAPLLSVFGGKLTTYRRLAESALARINAEFGADRPKWTASSVLPGGDFSDPESLAAELMAQIPDMPADTAMRLVRAYGRLAFEIIGDARTVADLGTDFGYGLSEAELAYLRKAEYAQSAEDILWRRSKLWLHLNPAQRQAVANWLENGAE